MSSGASFSEDRVYRYALWRTWDATLPSFVVIGLNPSTADERADDPTIRRCIGFAKRENCGGLVMLNLFAVRATDPRVMLAHSEPIGPENDRTLTTAAAESRIVVAAWGTKGSHQGRDRAVRALLPHMLCFGRTQGGHPRHPLYLPSDVPLVPYASSASPSPITERSRTP